MMLHKLIAMRDRWREEMNGCCGCADELDALIQEFGWRPIQTAPRDGTQIVLLIDAEKCRDIGIKASEVEAARWNNGGLEDGWWETFDDVIIEDVIKGWMPLPDPPTEQKE